MNNEFLQFIRSRKKLNLSIVAINILVYVIFTIIGSTLDSQFMYEHGAMFIPAVLEGHEYYRMFTSMFLHFGFTHILYNMICLIYLGDVLESVAGPIRYIVIYILGGLGGNALSMYINIKFGRNPLSCGASGAIFAVVGAVLYLVIRHKGRLGTISLRNIILMIVVNLGQGFMDTGVDNYAHIGGFVTGLILCIILYHPRKNRKTLTDKRR